MNSLETPRSAPGIERAIARATVRIPATCGELVQGTLDGVPFHITCPIDLYSTVTVELTMDPAVVAPANSWKAGVAARLILDRFRSNLGARVRIDSAIPRGKGMASSTADVGGVIAATALALGVALDPKTLARLALAVEPSDGCFFPGIVLFDHLMGSLVESLGGAPNLAVLALDFGGEVDTVSFNAVDRSGLLRELATAHADTLALARRGLAEGRLDCIGRAATLSAILNQSILLKPELPAVLDFAASVNALGVCVGHSGTVLGLLLDPVLADAGSLVEPARAALDGLSLALPSRMVNGGIRIVEVEPLEGGWLPRASTG